MKRILAGVDGSPESKQAAELSARLAAPLQARLTLVYVVTPPAPLGPELVVRSLQDLGVAQRDYGYAILREMAARCEGMGASVETRLTWGQPAETMADLAEHEGFDLVAVGHRGRGAVQRLLLGSVADRLAQISRKPVLIWRG